MKKADDTPGAIPGIDAALVHKIPMEELYRIIMSLPRRYKDVFSRFCFEGKNVSDTDKSRLKKARAMLIERLSDYLLDP